MAKGLSEDQIKWILSLDVSQAEEGTQKLAKQNRELTDRNKDLKKSMQQLEAQGKKNSENYKKLSDEYQKNSKQLTSNREMMKGLDRQMGVNNLTMVQLKRRAQDLQNQMNSTSKSLHPQEWKKLNQQLNETNTRIGQLKNSGSIIKEAFSIKNFERGVILAGVATFVSSLKGAFTIIKDFEKANADLAAVLGTTRSNIKPLTDEAKRLGATTAFTASQVTSLQVELAKLGFNQTEIVQSTKDVLAFAGATGAELPAAAKLAGAALRMFDLDATEMGRVVSTLAVATTKSALDFTYLETALSTVGPVAKTFGFTIEDTTAMLGTLANSGFDASSAATATRNILLNLADSSGKLAQALGRPITSFDELIPALSLLKSQGIDLASTLELTDKRSVAAFNSFLSGAESTLELRDSITDCGEALKAMQEEKLNTLTGSIALFSSAWEGLLLKFEKSNGIVKSVVDFFTYLLNTISRLIDWSSRYSSTIKIVSAAVISYIGTLKASLLLKEKHIIITNKSIIATTKEIIVEKGRNAVLAISKGATLLYAAAKAKLQGNTVRATAAMKLFNTVTKMNPLGLLVSLLTAATTAFIMFHKKSSDAASISEQATKNTKKEIKELTSLRKILNDSSLKYDERKAALDRIQELVPDYHASLTKEGQLINNNTDALDKYVKKLKVSEMMKITGQKLAEAKEKRSVFEENNKSGINKYVAAKMAYNEMDVMGNRKYDSLEEAAANIGMSPIAFRAIDKQIRALNDEVDRYENLMDEYTKELIKIDQNIGNSSKELFDGDKKKLVEESSLIVKLQKEKQNVQDTWKEDTEENIRLKNKELERLDNEIKKYQELGRTKKESKTKNEESPLVNDARKDYQQELSAQQQAYQQDLNNFRLLLQQKKITKEQYAIFEATLKSKNADALLEIEDNYYVALLGISARGEKIKEETISQEAKKVQDAEQASFDARLSAEQTFQNNLQAMRDMVQAPKQKPEDKLKAQYDLQLAMLESFNQASLEYAKQRGQDEAEVTRIYNEAKLSIDKKYQEEKEKLIKKSNDRVKGIEGNELSQYVADVWNAVNDLQDIFSHFSDPDFWENFGANIMETIGKLVNAVTGGLSSAFNTFKKIEMDNVEAKYNAEIEAAQGNSEEIERLEQEKAQKKLDIEKKYADIQFAIKASEIIANTALAIMQCMAQLGPIAGPIFAGFMAATGAIELAAANAERNKVKSMTLSGSNSSGNDKGTRVATGREEGGKIDITRAQDGKFFPNADYDPAARGFIDHPTVIVGEGPAGRSKEWVASNAAVENPTVAPFLQLLDAHQQAGDISTIDLNQIMRQRMAAGYVSGGSISPSQISSTQPSSISYNQSSLDLSVLENLNETLIDIKENGFPSFILLSDFEKKQTLRNRARQIGSK